MGLFSRFVGAIKDIFAAPKQAPPSDPVRDAFDTPENRTPDLPEIGDYAYREQLIDAAYDNKFRAFGHKEDFNSITVMNRLERETIGQLQIIAEASETDMVNEARLQGKDNPYWYH